MKINTILTKDLSYTISDPTNVFFTSRDYDGLKDWYGKVATSQTMKRLSEIRMVLDSSRGVVYQFVVETVNQDATRELIQRVQVLDYPVEAGAVMRTNYFQYSCDLYIDPYQFESTVEGGSKLLQVTEEHCLKGEVNGEKGCCYTVVGSFKSLKEYFDDLKTHNLISYEVHKVLIETLVYLKGLEVYVSTLNGAAVGGVGVRKLYVFGAEYSLYSLLKKYIESYLGEEVADRLRHKTTTDKWYQYSLYLNRAEYTAILNYFSQDRQPYNTKVTI